MCRFASGTVRTGDEMMRRDGRQTAFRSQMKGDRQMIFDLSRTLRSFFASCERLLSEEAEQRGGYESARLRGKTN